MSESVADATRVSLIELAWAFNHIALASFGGGLSAWSRQVLVVEKCWLGEEEFLSAMTMCRVLPGANQVNMAVFAGTKLRGLAGAVAAVFGLCLLPVIFMLIAGYFYFRFKEVPAVKGVLHGASAAAVALTVAMAIKTGRQCLTGLIPVALFAAAFVLNGILRWPLLLTLAILAPPALWWGVAATTLRRGRRVSTYLQLAGLFGMLSLLSIGGGNVVLPEMHLRAVQDHHWLTNSQFADVFSMSQAAPGPSILIVTLVGYGAGLRAGGVPGALLGGVVATVAMLLPAASVVFIVTRFWQRAQESKWRAAVEHGLAPLTVGLILATSLVMSRAADHDWRAYLLTAVCTVLFLRTAINPLIVVAAAGVLGYFGVL